MLHGDVRMLFEPAPDSHMGPSAEGILASCEDLAQFRKDFLRTLCEEPVYHYGFREAAGHGVGESYIRYKHRYKSSVFIDVLGSLIAHFGKELFFSDLLSLWKAHPDNMVLVQNLVMLFGLETVLDRIDDPDRLRADWEGLDKEPPEWKNREFVKRPNLEARLDGYTLEERLDKMWLDQDDAKQYLRYLGAKEDGRQLDEDDYEKLYNLISSGRYKETDPEKWVRMAKTFRQSEKEPFRKIGQRLLDAQA